MIDGSEIAKFYAFKKILITGGSGFMGRVLIWKLLYSCPELDTIYALMRSKHGKGLESRKETFFQSPIFDNFKKMNPKILEKVVFISGDVAEEGMGLSEKDRSTIINQVSIIFHGAAILKMDADLPAAVNVNTVGTKRMLELAEQMEKLQAFVHISTAFCIDEYSIVEEKIYPAKHDPFDIIRLTTWMEPELLEQITPKIIHPSPNTYIYSKRLTESLLQNYKSTVPIIVARPSIVLSCYKEPIPGWTDSMNGPTGFFIAGGKGILHTVMLNLDGKADIIPVDLAINSILILPWAHPRDQLLNQLSVYNISENGYGDITWRKMMCLLRAFDRYPFELVMWYRTAGESATKSYFVHMIRIIFLHYLPGYIIDFILLICGQKPFLVRTYDKLRQGEKVLLYFTYRPWSFTHNKMLELEKLLNGTDMRLFPVNMTRMGNFQDYMDDWMLSTKVHMFKESMNRLDKARRTMKIMYALDKIVLVLRYFILCKILMFVFNLLWSIFH